MIKIVNNTVPGALFKLGYKDAEVEAIVNYIDATGTIEGAPGVKPEHLAVFDCSFKPAKGTRSIQWLGHVKMMAATQPFLSGAISKTVNLPNDCSVQDIAEAYTESWRLGLKAVAIYRDGSKGTQPLNVTAQTDADKKGTSVNSSNKSVISTEGAAAAERPAVIAANVARAAAEAQLAEAQSQLASIHQANLQNADALDAQAPPRAVRHRLPAERASITHKFSIGGHEGYITVGLYPNGQPGEIFIRMAKEGSTISGLMDSFATAISLALQHGVPLKVLCEKFAHTRFEPSGWTGNEHLGYAKSIMDYLFRWMQLRFLSGQQLDLFANLKPSTLTAALTLSEPGAPSSAGSFTPDRVGSDIPEPHTILGEAFERNVGAPGQLAGWGDNDRTPPAEGIAPDLNARSGIEQASPLDTEDRSIYHTASAMKSLYDMGDAPSCSVCGSIMTRNGSCYRCMECGSTSGCS
jgi:ribonucleoside-diphosphate reductase alpha chain